MTHPLLHLDRAQVHMDRTEIPVEIDPSHPLFDHSVHGQRILPGAACWDLALAAGTAVLSVPPRGLTDVSMRAPFRPSADARVVLAWRDTALTFEILDGAHALCSGRFLLSETHARANPLPNVGARCAREFPPARLYNALRERGMHHGPALRALSSIRLGQGEALGHLLLPDAGVPGCTLEPSLVDAAMQVVAAWLLDGFGNRDGMYVPFELGQLRMDSALPRECLSHVVIQPSTTNELVRCDIQILDVTGASCAQLVGLAFKRVSAQQLARAASGLALQTVNWVQRLPGAAATAARLFVDGPDDVVAQLKHEGHVVLDSPGGAMVAFVAPEASDPVERFLASAKRLQALLAQKPASLLCVIPASDGPSDALLEGLCAALSDEYRDISCRSITAPRQHLAQSIAAELSEQDEPAVRWTAHGRMVPRVERVPLVPEAAAFHPGDVILVTGGAKGIGAEVCRHIARSVPCTLIIVGRSTVADVRMVIHQLESSGATVRYVQADVSTVEGVDRIKSTITHVGQLNGVIHAAGSVAAVRFSAKTDDGMRAVLAPKVVGLHLMRDALEDRLPSLRFFALFSSISSVMRGMGGALADYVSANAFLDEAARAWGPPFVSINWSAWRDAGMAADAGIAAALQLPALSTESAVGALEQALVSGLRQVVVAERKVRLAEPAAVQQVSTQGGALEALLRAAVAEQLGVDPSDVPLDEPFTALGLDSLAALDVARSLEDHDIGPMQPTMLFEYPTIRALASHLETRPRAAGSPARPAAVSHDPFELTHVQRAFFVNHRLHDELNAYSFLRQTVDGPLDVELLRRVVALLDERHPMLRARFFLDGRTPKQRFVPVDRADWMEVGPLVGDLHQAEEELANTRFNLEHAPPIRLQLLQEGPARTQLLMAIHHIAADAWSLNVLAEDMWHAYSQLSAGRPINLPPIPSTFRDVVEHEQSEHANAERDRQWWHERLSREDVVTLPYDGNPDSRRLCSLQVTTDAGLTRSLMQLAAEHGVSLFQLLLAVQFSVVGEWAGLRRFAVNVAHARRHHRVQGIERMVGCFADTLPVHATLDGNESPVLLAQRLRAAWLEVQGHSHVTSVDLARALKSTDGNPRNAAPVSFSFARFPVEKPDDSPIDVTGTSGATASAATRLGLAGWELKGVLQFSWNFPSWLFKRETVESLANRHLEALRALSQPAARNTAFHPVHRRIVEQASKTPHAVAVWTPERCWTFHDLERRSAAVASEVRHISDGSPHVGILCRQGFNGAAAIVGILRSGKAWVPMDDEHPVKRLMLQLDVAQCSIVVCETATLGLARQLGVKHLVVVDDAQDRADSSDEDVRPESTAYVIFTSGSTGTPKGVPITQRSMAHYLDFAVSIFRYHRDDRMAQTSSLCFDASVRQVLAPLLVGAAMVVVPRHTARDPEVLLQLVERSGLTVWSSVPSLLERLTAVIETRLPRPDLSKLRHVHVGGEALHASLVRRWMDATTSRARISNLYGPTEVTINATWHEVGARPGEDEDRVPIGRPLPGRTIRIVGETGEDAEEGELHVGGIGLSPGYLGPPELTERAFVVARGDRWYRTGDRVKRLRNGTLEFLGRMDDQVKIRGFRIEPAEVESCLARHPAVSLVAVLPVEQDGRRQLEAFVTLRTLVGDAQLKRHCAELLPDFMVPTRIHVVEDMPLTAGGKVDRARLVPVDPPRPQEGLDRPPATPTEKLLSDIWARVLRVPVDGRDADFFELGGDSVAVLEVFAELAKHRDQLPRPTLLYQRRTLRSLAAFLDGEAAPEKEPTHAAEFPLAPSQMGFVLAELTSPERALTWSATMRLPLRVDPTILQRALDFLVERHPMLRAVIFAEQRPPVQRILERPGAFPLMHERCSNESDVERIRVRESLRRFNLAEWPLMTMTLCDVESAQSIVITAHHALGDATSTRIITGELMSVYQALAAGQTPSRPPLRGTFADCVALLAAGIPAGSADYWRNTFATQYLPPRATTRRATTARTVDVDASRTRELMALAAAHRTSLHGVMLTLVFHALRNSTGQSDLVVATAIDGRHLPVADIDRIVGCLATVLPVRCNVEGRRWQDLIPVVVNAYRKARAHAAAPVEVLQCAPGTTPLIGAQFVLSVMDDDDTTQAAMADVPNETDLFVAVRKLAEGLRVVIMAPGVAGDAVEALTRELGRPRGAVIRTTQEPLRARVDSALIGYLPAVPVPLKGMVTHVLFGRQRHACLERLTTPLGTSAYIAIPRFADDLMQTKQEALIRDVEVAAAFAREMGARTVSLAGLIPSLTEYGFAIGGTDLTTGHAATVCSVVKTVQCALEGAGRRMEDQVLAVLGVGSIGQAALRLLLRVSGHPREVLLVDTHRGAMRAAAFEKQLRNDDGFTRRIRTVIGTRQAPDEVYEATLMLGATSAPDVITVDALRPGTILVDDSFPHCFDVEAALQRMRTNRDVLVVGGGLLDCGPLEREVFLPAEGALIKDQLVRHLSIGGVAGCQLEPLMCLVDASLPSRKGLVEVSTAALFMDAADRLGITAAPLHLGEHLVDLSTLDLRHH